MEAPQSQGCSVPPAGWYCTRQRGHTGPCAAWPEAARNSGNVISDADWDRIRTRAAYPSEVAPVSPAPRRGYGYTMESTDPDIRAAARSPTRKSLAPVRISRHDSEPHN